MKSEKSLRSRARELAAEYVNKGDPTGWFEQLYREAESNDVTIPWADLKPNPNLIEFWSANGARIPLGPAVAIGCGFGDDAEQLSTWGFDTVAFDISASAIHRCARRFPNSRVRHMVADLLNPPREWFSKFDFVLEAYTLQVLPAWLRKQAIARIAEIARPGGFVLVIARARDGGEPGGEMPWPLTRAEMDEITRAGLIELSFEDYYDDESPRVRRFRALYRKPDGAVSDSLV